MNFGRFSHNPGFLRYKVNITFMAETLPYSQICGTKVCPSYKKRRHFDFQLWKRQLRMSQSVRAVWTCQFWHAELGSDIWRLYDVRFYRCYWILRRSRRCSPILARNVWPYYGNFETTPWADIWANNWATAGIWMELWPVRKKSENF